MNFLVMSLVCLVCTDVHAASSLKTKKLTSVSSKLASPSSASVSQTDINNAFQAVRASDYNKLSKLLKKYSDPRSIKTILTAVEISLVATGQTLLHKASGLSDLNTALRMGILIVNKALEVSPAFQVERILAKDVQGKTPVDYATSIGNTQLISVFSSLTALAQAQASMPAQSSISTPAPTSTSVSASTSAPAPVSTLQDDINTAFQKIAAVDYMGMSKLVKKYTDTPSLQTMLTAVQNGQTLLQAAANVADSSVAIQMVARITSQASLVSRDFQLQIIAAQDSQGKTAHDYAAEKGNTQLIDMLNQLSGQ